MSRTVFAALLLAVLALAVPGTTLGAAPTCFGKPATYVMQPSEGIYVGTTRDDVVVGTAGADSIFLSTSGGIDLACGGGGNDSIQVAGSSSKADGGPGADLVYAEGGALARGGSGNDLLISAADPGSRAEGGSGNDVVQAYFGAVADGGSGNDNVQGNQAAALLGGSGSDTMYNNGSNTLIDCGAAYDRYFANGATDIRRCEGVYIPNG